MFFNALLNSVNKHIEKTKRHNSVIIVIFKVLVTHAKLLPPASPPSLFVSSIKAECRVVNLKNIVSAPQILEQNRRPSRTPFIQPRLGDMHFIDSSQKANSMLTR